MAYLRRMKKIAESIRDDIGHSPGKHPSGGHESGSGKSSRASKAAGSQHEAADAVETPRSASLSKMRAKLERMRSDSLLSLLDRREEGEEGEAEGNPDAKAVELDQQHSNQREHSQGHQQPENKQSRLNSATRTAVGCSPPPPSKPAVILVEDSRVFTTSAQVCEGERQLARAAAVRLVQRFYRGAACRQRLRHAKRVSYPLLSLVDTS